MSLELPGPAVVAFNLVGLPWPGLDEDVLRAWAKDLRAFSAQLSDSSGRSRDRVAAMAGVDPSPPAKALLARWEHYHGVISALRGPMEAFAGALDVAADAVVAQKGIVIAAAVALAAEVVATQGEALATFGLAEAEVPAEVAATRLVVKGVLQYLEGELLGRLVGAACSQLSAHLGGAVSKLVTGGGQAAVEASSLKAIYDQGTLQSLGTALNGHQAQVDSAGAGSLRLASGRQLATGGPGGGWREVAVAVEQAVLRVLAQLFKDLARAFHAIVDDTTAAIKSMITQLKHMDAQRATEPGAITAGADPESGVLTRDHSANEGTRGGPQLARTMENVRDVIDRYGIRMNKGARIRIDKGLRGVRGITEPNRTIRLSPQAFENEEQLARTIYHENIHVGQISANGHYFRDAVERDRWEQEAWEAELRWWTEHPLNPQK